MIWAVVLSVVASWPGGAPAASRQRLDAVWDALEIELIVAGDRHWHAGRYDHLARLGYVWMETHPDNPNSFISTGFILGNGLSRYDEAEKVYHRLIDAHPDDWSAWHELVWFLYWRERYTEAIEPGERMLSLSPMTTAYHLVAHCYEKAGDLEKSVLTWKRAISRDPADETAVRNMERVQKLIDERKKEGEDR
jgi:tetratricopeptide (TPR) repeat protein